MSLSFNLVHIVFLGAQLLVTLVLRIFIFIFVDFLVQNLPPYF